MSQAQSAKPFRVGILGGMGPLAGIELHRLIVEATPAQRDQDHMQVVLFTNPAIPDRTTSLQEDDGKQFAYAAGDSLAEMEAMNVNIAVMACMTAHSRLEAIQARTTIPILNAIPLVHSALTMHYPGKDIALLATPGSINSGIYTVGSPAINWLLPSGPVQKLITNAIYRIKAGSMPEGKKMLQAAVDQLRHEGAEVFVLGCTELSLLYCHLQEKVLAIDPLRLVAEQLVILHNIHRSAAQLTPTKRPQNV